MRLARLAAVWTRKQSATIGPKPVLLNIRSLARIQSLIKQPPARRHPQAKRQYLRPICRPFSVLVQTEQKKNALGSQILSNSTWRI